MHFAKDEGDLMNINYEFVLPVVISFGVSVVLCPIVIPFLRILKFGQFVRDDGPQSHLRKAGTPTMGGLIILSSILLTSLIYTNKYPEIFPVLFMTLGFGLIGFLDDYIKVVMRRSLGLTPLYKLTAQFLVTSVFVYYYFRIAGMDTYTVIPFLHREYAMPAWFFVMLLYIVVLGTVNGVNFTDGLDGLCASVTVLVAIFLTAVSCGENHGIEPVFNGLICKTAYCILVAVRIGEVGLDIIYRGSVHKVGTAYINNRSFPAVQICFNKLYGRKPQRIGAEG